MTYAIALNNADKKPAKLERAVFHAALAISYISVIYLISVYIVGYSWIPFISVEIASSELTLSLLQCLLGAAALHVPMLLKKLTKIRFPDVLCSCFYVFVLCGTVLGEVFSLYYRVSFWDSLLHFGSGIMCGMLGSILLVNFLRNKKCTRLITPMFIAAGAVCFSICIGVFWEIYEFAGDSILGLNMQKCFLEDGTALMGQAGLLDTMKDLMLDTFGAVAAAVSSFLSLKRHKGWLSFYLIDEVKEPSGELKIEKQVLKYSA